MSNRVATCTRLSPSWACSASRAITAGGRKDDDGRRLDIHTHGAGQGQHVATVIDLDGTHSSATLDSAGLTNTLSEARKQKMRPTEARQGGITR